MGRSRRKLADVTELLQQAIARWPTAGAKAPKKLTSTTPLGKYQFALQPEQDFEHLPTTQVHKFTLKARYIPALEGIEGSINDFKA